MKLFVSADVHGFYDHWLTALSNAGFDVQNPDHKLLVCGDLFDRGGQAKELQAFLLEMIEKDKIILIRGNHEDLLLDLVDNYGRYVLNVEGSKHGLNGTFQTVLDLTGMDYYEATESLFHFRNKAEETPLIKTIIPKMLNYYETEKYIFVHSWIPLKNGNTEFNENWRNATEKEWQVARWINPLDCYKLGLFPKDKTLVFGHWHVSNFWWDLAPKSYEEDGKTSCYDPFITNEIIALDARTVVSKKVNVVVLEV